MRWGIIIWAGIIGDSLVGPYILPERLNGEAYNNFLQNTLPVLINEVVPEHIQQRMWYQQDEAPAHFRIDVRATLNNMFPNKWIGRGGPTAWPARSPDLTPLDFFSLGNNERSCL